MEDFFTPDDDLCPLREEDFEQPFTDEHFEAGFRTFIPTSDAGAAVASIQNAMRGRAPANKTVSSSLTAKWTPTVTLTAHPTPTWHKTQWKPVANLEMPRGLQQQSASCRQMDADSMDDDNSTKAAACPHTKIQFNRYRC